MCGFIFTNVKEFDLENVNAYSVRRGPDLTTTVHKGDFTFIHNLLSITGNLTPQPFVNKSDNIYCVYNGEIYNYENFANQTLCSDGESIIPAYNHFGETFAKHLDGEFAVVLVDFQKGIILTSTDTFAIKPIWFAKHKKNFGVASYKSNLIALGFPEHTIKKHLPNKTNIFNVKNFEILRSFTNYQFDVSNQHKDNFTDWSWAFENSLRKRTDHLREKVFIGLSSGYDSGAIACGLTKLGVDFQAYSISGKENKDTLRSRQRITKNHTIVELNTKDVHEEKEFVKKNCEEFQYQIYRDGVITPDEYLSEDEGAIGLSYVCKLARRDGGKIYLSGQGADEIFSDYGYKGRKIYSHSNFGGIFPANLGEVFPWMSFYFSTQLSYLAKEEYISGCHGVEGRYPYLDRFVVQEFLWLSQKLKNEHYKSPIYNYLRENNYPFSRNEKIGFNCMEKRHNA